MNDASSDTIRNCTLKGAEANIFGGVVSIYNSYLNTGNDNNAIIGCDIGKSGNNKPYFCIYSKGTFGKENDGIFIDHCTIHDFQSYGIILIQAGDNYTTTSNKIYQPDTSAGENLGIHIYGGSGHTISYNIIGGNDVNSGGYWVMRDGGAYFWGIYLFSSSGDKPIHIEGNVIKRIYMYDVDGGSLYGIVTRTLTTTYINYNDIGEYANMYSIISLANSPVKVSPPMHLTEILLCIYKITM